MKLSPVTRRRLAIFRQHRRGYVSFWIFLVLFGTSLFAEFIANDRPLLIRFDDHWYVPVLEDYSEDTFGREFMPTEADYSDPVLQQLIEAHGWMIWPRSHTASQPRSRTCQARRPRHPRHAICWARTTRGATCWRASSTGCACRCCSASR